VAHIPDIEWHAILGCIILTILQYLPAALMLQLCSWSFGVLQRYDWYNRLDVGVREIDSRDCPRAYDGQAHPQVAWLRQGSLVYWILARTVWVWSQALRWTDQLESARSGHDSYTVASTQNI